jgi:hypothetical protein
MIVNQWIEPYTLMMGIHTMDVLIEALCVSGLVYAPFAVAIIVSIVEALSQGEDEGNAGELAVKFLRKKMLMIMPVFILAFVPMSSSDITFDMAIAGYGCDADQHASPATNASQQQLLGNFTNVQKKVPVWWLMVHDMASTISNTTIASTPCAADLTMAETNISGTALANTYDQQLAKTWQSSCLNPAVSQISKTGAVDNELWVGSGSLRSVYSKSESVMDVPIETAQLAGFTSATGASSAGATMKVNCDTVYQHIETAAVAAANNADSSSLSLLEQAESAVSADAGKKIAMKLVAKVSVNPYQNPDMSDDDLPMVQQADQARNDSNFLSYYAALIGTAVGNIMKAPSAVIQKMTAPILICIFQMLLLAVSPILLVFSGFNIKTTLGLSGLYFGLEFTLVIINMATWVDNTLTIFFKSGSLPDLGMQSSILNAVAYSGYDLLPKVWMAMLSYLSIKGGSQMMGSALSEISKAAGDGSKQFLQAVNILNKTVRSAGKKAGTKDAENTTSKNKAGGSL